MTDDGPSVPKTLPYTGPLPQLGPWFDSSKSIVERAAALKELPVTRGRVEIFQILVHELSRRETDTTTTVADLFEAAFDDRSGAAFWGDRLSLMTHAGQFTAMLLPFLTLESGDRSLNTLLLDSLLREDLPASGLLREGRFDPLPVVRWIGARRGYGDMLPASLHEFLKSPVDRGSVKPLVEAVTTPLSKKKPGRPSPIHLIRSEWLSRQQLGGTLSVKADEARALLLWLARNHPAEKPPSLSTVQNHLSNEFATLKVQVKGS